MQRILLHIAVFCVLLTAVPGILQAQSLTINQGYMNVGLGQTIQYSTTAVNLSSNVISWYVANVRGGNTKVGTISSTGLYQAPAAVPSGGAVTVTALAADGRTSSTVYANVQEAGPSITSVFPANPSVGTTMIVLKGSNFQSGSLLLFDGVVVTPSLVTSSTMVALVWRGQVGTAALSVRNPTSLWGPAYSLPFKSSTPQTIAPGAVTLALGSTQQFVSTGATSFNATAGTIDANGYYTAPSIMPANPQVTISAVGANGTATSTVTLLPALVISPATTSLSLGAVQQFLSTGATSWTATAGTVSSTGFYTAPTSLPSNGLAQITAAGPGGSVTATVTLVAPRPVILSVGLSALPLGIFTTSVSGTNFSSQSVAYLNGNMLATSYTNGSLTIVGTTTQVGSANLTVANGATVSDPFPVQIVVANSLASPAAARRFLEQAAFGPTPTDAVHLQSVGLKNWLNEQFTMSQISNYDSITSSQSGMPAHFLTMAVTNPDQLRQRVAFALSQIFVTSLDKVVWNETMKPFQNMLLADAFSNYRQIMSDVTLSSAMGQYLDMGNNAKADPSIGSVANENYARELMQLFTLGTNLLNTDGSVMLDSNGLPIPTYSQFTVTEFARVFTGWTYAPAAAGSTAQWNTFYNSNGPMVPYSAQHDMGSKQLLNGFTSPAGLSPQQDLDNALDNIFNHPNIGPFVARQLIVHLVKSNPSAAYIARVAAAFNDNGKNVRGDMRAVVTAVLLDPEARANDEGGHDQATDGHLQEPALFIAGMVRAFGGQMNDQNYYPTELTAMGQNLFNSPSVFNYYSPDFLIPGTTTTGGEFQIYTPNIALIRMNEVYNLIFSQYESPLESIGPGTSIDLTPYVSLALTPAVLVNALDLTLTHGVMPADMKAKIIAAVTADTGSSVHKTQTAAYLILTSSYYNVWH